MSALHYIPPFFMPRHCTVWPGIWRTSKTGEKRNSANWVFHCNILCGNLLTKTWRRRGGAEKLQSVILNMMARCKNRFESLNKVLCISWSKFYAFLGGNLHVSCLEHVVCLCFWFPCDVDLAWVVIIGSTCIAQQLLLTKWTIPPKQADLDASGVRVVVSSSTIQAVALIKRWWNVTIHKPSQQNQGFTQGKSLWNKYYIQK